MNIRYRVDLTAEERDELVRLLSAGKCAARRLKWAQILLAAAGGAGDEDIERTIGASGSTIYRTKRRFVEYGLEAALSEEPRCGAERKLTGKQEALLVATACSKPPPGRSRWTLELLAGEMIKLTDHQVLSRETVRRRLAENGLKPCAGTCGASRRSMPSTAESEAKRPVIPTEGGHPIRSKAATDSDRRRPPC